MNKDRPIRYAYTPSGCWICVSHRARSKKAPRPWLRRDQRWLVLAHWEYEKAGGSLLPGQRLHPACRERRCCNPEHQRVAGNGPIPDAVVLEIRAHPHRSCPESARLHGLSPDTVRQILYGKTRPDLPGALEGPKPHARLPRAALTGGELRSLRREAGLRLAELARASGVHVTTLVVLERGRRALTERAAGRILPALERLKAALPDRKPARKPDEPRYVPKFPTLPGETWGEARLRLRLGVPDAREAVRAAVEAHGVREAGRCLGIGPELVRRILAR